MEFRRITSLPPYVFTIIDSLKIEQRRAGKDIIDLGFGNPDLASPDVAVDKLIEAAQNSRNHRYSSSRGIPKLREAIAGYYQRRFGVTLDPETEVINTIGAKEGFSHLMWTLLQPGDAALVPSPSYPIHIYGPLLAGAELIHSAATVQTALDEVAERIRTELADKNPLVLCVMASLAGVPPFLGFWSKLAVLRAAVEAGQLWLAIVAIVFAVVGAFYYLRVIKAMYFDEPSGEPVTPREDHVVRVVFGVNALGLLALGLLWSPLMAWCQRAFA